MIITRFWIKKELALQGILDVFTISLKHLIHCVIFWQNFINTHNDKKDLQINYKYTNQRLKLVMLIVLWDIVQVID